ncbi:PilN domain-containing protein [Pseudomonas silvicola]|nr:PilN domain-containing protein [Pseudomonas silvicola]
MRAVSLWLWQQRLKGLWQGSAVQGFCRAWGQELLASLPAALRRGLQPGRAPRRCPWPLPAEALPGERLVLELPADRVLVQRLGLPLAAARDLHRVMDFELDRFTPFSAGQVHYVVRREGIDSDQVGVTLAVLRREWLQQCLDECHARGVVLAGIDVLDARGQPMGLDLLPHAPAASGGGQRLAWGLALLCLTLLAAVPWQWRHNRETALAAMTQEVQGLRTQAEAVAALRKRLDEAQGAAQFLARRRLAQPGRALLLSELSRCLPTDTWLQTLEINGEGQVDIAGFSSHASGLIAQVKGCNHLADAQYQGVIQPDEASGRERFYMRARARGEGGDAPRTDTP